MVLVPKNAVCQNSSFSSLARQRHNTRDTCVPGYLQRFCANFEVVDKSCKQCDEKTVGMSAVKSCTDHVCVRGVYQPLQSLLVKSSL